MLKEHPSFVKQNIAGLDSCLLFGSFGLAYYLVSPFKPLSPLLTYWPMFIGFIGFCLGLYYVAKRLVNIETAPTGFTTLAALVLFLGGVQLIAIGVLGEYLGRIYDEVKQRPVYLVKPPRVSG